MADHVFTRRSIATALAIGPMLGGGARAAVAARGKGDVVAAGAVADGRTVNTAAIQGLIDRLAASGGGTVVVPAGVFVTGALFLKPGVHLHLDRGSVLRCSSDPADFPPRRTRIEGHFEERFTPALINASGCNGLKITGEGTLDGAGRPVWDRFWALRNAAPDPGNFPNVGISRARLALIERSDGVTVEGVTFKDSQFWNLHLYRCRSVVVRGARFEVPDDYPQAPSSDGIDVDSCQQVEIDGCTFSVTDDCIALKGSKGPRAMEDKDSPPVERVRIRNCQFRRGHQLMSCGSEATIVRDVVVENCRVTAPMNVAMLKLRSDTPQHYENIVFRNITLDAAGGSVVLIQPWSQYKDLKGMAPPQSIVRNVMLEGIRGRFGAFGTIRPNPGQTTIEGIVFKNIDLQLAKPDLAATGVKGLRFEGSMINGKPIA